jgi:hypothetical protein
MGDFPGALYISMRATIKKVQFVGLSGTYSLNASDSKTICEFEVVHYRRYNLFCGGKRDMRS